jgi:hypothetical protein
MRLAELGSGRHTESGVQASAQVTEQGESRGLAAFARQGEHQAGR